MLPLKTLFLVCLFFIFSYSQSINIAVSSNTSHVIQELKKEFLKTHPHTKIRVTISSSGKLSAQIQNNAPYHIFMSADMLYPNILYKKNLTITKPIVYARGRLSLFSREKRDFTKNINIIKSNQIKKISIANPKTAPYGKASMEVIKNTNLYQKIYPKLIYAESISQALLYARVSADIGFIASSLLHSPKMKSFIRGEHWEFVNSELYTPIEQGIVLLKRGTSNTKARDLYSFILSKKAKKIFADFGYI